MLLFSFYLMLMGMGTVLFFILSMILSVKLTTFLLRRSTAVEEHAIARRAALRKSSLIAEPAGEPVPAVVVSAAVAAYRDGL